MEKYLVTVEFWYNDAPEFEGEYRQCISKTVTVGVFETRDEANNAGNSALEVFESKFKLNPHYNRRLRFSNNGGCFGEPITLITELAYLETPFHFCAKITTLNYSDVMESIVAAVNATKRYREYQSNKIE